MTTSFPVEITGVFVTCRMARLRRLREKGELHTGIKYSNKHQYTTVKVGIMPEEYQYLRKDNAAWLIAGLTALHGSHSDRTWSQVLRALAHGGTKD